MLTTIHTIISFIAIGTGIMAMPGLFGAAGREGWTKWFLITAVLTTVTGFFFPFIGITPAFGTGIVAGIVLAAVLYARYGRGLAGGWGAVYAAGMVLSLYLLVFVLIAQAFTKVPALTALAPTGTEPPFAVAQLICLAGFAWLGFRAVRRHRMRPAAGA